MSNPIKSVIESHRIGASAGKTLLWIWVKKDLQEMKGDLGVDLAGGKMSNKRFFATKNYISVDIDQAKLDAGKNTHPDAIALNNRIQDFLQVKNRENPDVLVCVQTMGTNKFFEHSETLDVVKSMYVALRPGGGMIFNIGSNGINLNEIEQDLSAFLEKKFERVTSRYYGAMHLSQTNRVPGFTRLCLAHLMNAVVPLRTFCGFKKRKLYYCCRRKLS